MLSIVEGCSSVMPKEAHAALLTAAQTLHASHNSLKSRVAELEDIHEEVSCCGGASEYLCHARSLNH
jgi:hypothetical protein